MQDLERNVGAREAGGGWRGREVSSGERRAQRGGERRGEREKRGRGRVKGYDASSEARDSCLLCSIET